MPNEPPPISQRGLLALIMGGLVVWAAYVAVGSYLYNFNPWRAVIVMGCMGVFLGVWLLLLWSRGSGKKES
jgi:hypothetical protein